MNVRALQKHEAERMAQMRQATSAAELRAIFGGHSYGDEES